jgi:hypothetical protein
MGGQSDPAVAAKCALDTASKLAGLMYSLKITKYFKINRQLSPATNQRKGLPNTLFCAVINPFPVDEPRLFGFTSRSNKTGSTLP